MKTFKQFLEQSLVGNDGDFIEDPKTKGFIDIHTKPTHAPRSQSVVQFYVPPEHEGKGVGTSLLNKALEKHKDLGAQVSSLPSLKIFHNAGFRHIHLPEGDFNEHKKTFQEKGGSLFMAKNDEHGVPYVK